MPSVSIRRRKRVTQHYEGFVGLKDSETQPTILILITSQSQTTILSSFEYLFFAAIHVFAAFLILGQLLVYNLTDFGL